jgi:fusion and transport protein UGO1
VKSCGVRSGLQSRVQLASAFFFGCESSIKLLCIKHSHKPTVNMPASILKRPRAEDRARDRPTKKHRKFKKQLDYHSSSDDEAEDDEAADFQAVNLQDSDEELALNTTKNAEYIAEGEDDEAQSQDGASDQEDEEQDDDNDNDAASDITGASSGSERSETSTLVTEGGTRTKKRNDPTAFATSISKILSSKLTTTKRSDPVLSRSASAAATSKALADSKLDAKARQKLRADRRIALEKGRVRDVLGLETPEESTQAIMEREKKLTKKVSEMSKQGFLDLISSGGKKNGVATAKA